MNTALSIDAMLHQLLIIRLLHDEIKNNRSSHELYLSIICIPIKQAYFITKFKMKILLNSVSHDFKLSLSGQFSNLLSGISFQNQNHIICCCCCCDNLK